MPAQDASQAGPQCCSSTRASGPARGGALRSLGKPQGFSFQKRLPPHSVQTSETLGHPLQTRSAASVRGPFVPGAQYRPDLPLRDGLGDAYQVPRQASGFFSSVGLPPLCAQISVPMNHHALPSPRAVQAPGFCCEPLQQDWHTATKLRP